MSELDFRKSLLLLFPNAKEIQLISKLDSWIYQMDFDDKKTIFKIPKKKGFIEAWFLEQLELLNIPTSHVLCVHSFVCDGEHYVGYEMELLEGLTPIIDLSYSDYKELFHNTITSIISKLAQFSISGFGGIESVKPLILEFDTESDFLFSLVDKAKRRGVEIKDYSILINSIANRETGVLTHNDLLKNFFIKDGLLYLLDPQTSVSSAGPEWDVCQLFIYEQIYFADCEEKSIPFVSKRELLYLALIALERYSYYQRYDPTKLDTLKYIEEQAYALLIK
ncbi:hypothetical protein JXA48_03795 [Candidatus Woesearchaeota archaeon]|nr:hypothetical protein [Candidatus Woesearchaeota archaeon]